MREGLQQGAAHRGKPDGASQMPVEMTKPKRSHAQNNLQFLGVRLSAFNFRQIFPPTSCMNGI